jgi:RNA polymerase sigma-70 factor (ECF subfamily)
MATVVDADIMTRVASGEREAVGVLYDRYGATLLPIALRIVGNRADAEDVLHDAFVTLPARARHYSAERGSVGAWLVILVRNLSIDRTRRRGVRQSVQSLQAAASPEAQDASPDPEASAQIAKRQEQIRRALASLPDAQRTTLQTAFFEGLSYPEISARDGVSLGTVKSRAARALAALRAALAAEGFSDDVL